jgi:hypothetical protein
MDDALRQFLVLSVECMICIELNGRHLRIATAAGKAAEVVKFALLNQLVLCAMNEEKGASNLPNVSIDFRPGGFRSC